MVTGVLEYEQLKAAGLSKYRLRKFFAAMGCPMNAPHMDRRFKDQDWSARHADLLRQVGLWVDLSPRVTKEARRALFTDDRIAKSYDDDGVPLPNLEMDHSVIIQENPNIITVKVIDREDYERQE